MNSSKIIQSKVEELKNNVANQNKESLWEKSLHEEGEVVILEDKNSGDLSIESTCLRKEPRESSCDFNVLNHGTEIPQDEHKNLQWCRQRLSMFGMELVISTGVSYALAWGLGSLFTLSSLWRIIMGAVIAFAVNALAVYRIIKQ